MSWFLNKYDDLRRLQRDGYKINIRCEIFNIHSWNYFRMAKSFEDMYPDTARINRRCVRCKRMQCTDDETSNHWTQRL
jgi:hypothetical protein